MKEIPFFSVENVNRVEGYKRFRHSRTYFKQRSGEHRDEKTLLLACGYSFKSLNKFRIHRKAWNDLSRKIPLKYAQAIGIDPNVMDTVLDADQREFDQALQLPFFPKTAGVRLLAAVYATYEFPPNVTENEAISILKAYSEKTGRYCFIQLAEIKTIWVRPESVFTDIYRPEIETGKVWLTPSADGAWVGKSYLV